MAKKRTKPEQRLASRPRDVPTPAKLLKELRDLIHAAHGAIAQAVNSGQVMLYWQVGHRLRTEVLGAKRAGYGERIVATVAVRLTAELGGASPTKICGTCSDSPKRSPTGRLSPH